VAPGEAALEVSGLGPTTPPEPGPPEPGPPEPGPPEPGPPEPGPPEPGDVFDDELTAGSTGALAWSTTVPKKPAIAAAKINGPRFPVTCLPPLLVRLRCRSD